MKLPIDDVVSCVTDLAALQEPILIGIDGGAGAGKTTFADRFAHAVSETAVPVSVVRADGFYKCAAERWAGPIQDQPIGHDLDWQRLWDQVIDPLRAGRRARYQPFDWPADRLKDWVTVDPVGVVIIEGVFALRNELSDSYDLRIWLSCPRDTCVSRILDRGDMTPSELERWIPGEEAYTASHAPDQRAHLIVDGAVGVWAESGPDWIEAIRWSPPEGSP